MADIYFLDPFTRHIKKTDENKTITTDIEDITSYETVEFFSLQTSSTHFYLFGDSDSTIWRRAITDATGSWIKILDLTAQDVLLSLPVDYALIALEDLEHRLRSYITTADDNVYIAYTASGSGETITYVLQYNGTSWSKLITAQPEQFAGWADLNYDANLVGLKTYLKIGQKYATSWSSGDEQVHKNGNKLRIISGSTITIVDAPTNATKPVITVIETPMSDLPGSLTGFQPPDNLVSFPGGYLVGTIKGTAGNYLVKINQTDFTYTYVTLTTPNQLSTLYPIVSGNYILVFYASTIGGIGQSVLFSSYDSSLALVHGGFSNVNLNGYDSGFWLVPTGNGKFITANNSPYSVHGKGLCFEIDAIAGTITAKTNTPVDNMPGANANSVKSNGDIVFGPENAGSTAGTFYIYSVTNDTWTTQANIISSYAGRLNNKSTVIRAPGDPWDNYVLTYSNGTFESYILYDSDSQVVIKAPLIPFTTYGLAGSNFSPFFGNPDNFLHFFNFPNYYEVTSDYAIIGNVKTDTVTVLPLDTFGDTSVAAAILGPWGEGFYLTQKDANTLNYISMLAETININTNEQNIIIFSADISLNTAEPIIALANIQAVTAVSSTDVYCATVGASHHLYRNGVTANDYYISNYGDYPEPKLLIYHWNGSVWSLLYTISDSLYTWLTRVGMGGEAGDYIQMPYTPLLMSHRTVGGQLELVMLRDTTDSVYVYNTVTQSLLTAALQPQVGAENIYRSEPSPSIPYVYNELLSSSVSQSYRSGHILRNEIEVYAEARLAYNSGIDLYWLDRNKQPIFYITPYGSQAFVVNKNNTYYLKAFLESNLPNTNSVIATVGSGTTSGMTVNVQNVTNQEIDFELILDNSINETTWNTQLVFDLTPFEAPSSNISTTLQVDLYPNQPAPSPKTYPGSPTGTVASPQHCVFNAKLYVFGGYSGLFESSDASAWRMSPISFGAYIYRGSSPAYINTCAICGIAENSQIGLLTAVGGAGIQHIGEYSKPVSFSVTDSSITLSSNLLTKQDRWAQFIEYDGYRYICIAGLDIAVPWNNRVITTSTDLITWANPEFTTAGGTNGNAALKYSNGVTMACTGDKIYRIVASTGVMTEITGTGIIDLPIFASDGAGNWLMSGYDGANQLLFYSTNNGTTWTSISVPGFSLANPDNIISLVITGGYFYAFFYGNYIFTTVRSTSVDFTTDLQKYIETDRYHCTGVEAFSGNLISLYDGSWNGVGSNVQISTDNGATWV